MEFVKTKIEGVFIITPKLFEDARGWFMESYSQARMAEAGLSYSFVQDNHSYSSQKGVLRGIHLQLGEHAQAKLVRVTKGAVLDVAVDLRKTSPTYTQWVAVELSAENKRQLLIPRGFGHGFVTLTDEVEFLYKADNLYNAQADRSILWCDENLAIDWGIKNPIVSDKDKKAPTFKELEGELKW